MQPLETIFYTARLRPGATTSTQVTAASMVFGDFFEGVIRVDGARHGAMAGPMR